MQEFQDDGRKILAVIKNLLIEHNIISDDTTAATQAGDELDETMLLRLYKNIDHCIDQFDFAKVFDILDEIKNYQVPEEHKVILDKLDVLMEDLDVDAIKELLSSVI